MSAHVGPLPVEELLVLVLGGGAACAAARAWLWASAARLARRRDGRMGRRSRG